MGTKSSITNTVISVLAIVAIIAGIATVLVISNNESRDQEYYAMLLRTGQVMCQYNDTAKAHYYNIRAVWSDAISSHYKDFSSEVDRYSTKKTESLKKLTNTLSDINQNLAKGTDIDITNGRFTASLPAQSVTTFVGVVDSGPPTSIGGKSVVRNYTTPLVTIRGRTLNVNSSNDSRVRVKIVNMTGKTVANFSASGNAKLPLKQIPAGAYVIEARRVKDGYRMTSSVMLR